MCRMKPYSNLFTVALHQPAPHEKELALKAQCMHFLNVISAGTGIAPQPSGPMTPVRPGMPLLCLPGGSVCICVCHRCFCHCVIPQHFKLILSVLSVTLLSPLVFPKPLHATFMDPSLSFGHTHSPQIPFLLSKRGLTIACLDQFVCAIYQ